MEPVRLLGSLCALFLVLATSHSEASLSLFSECPVDMNVTQGSEVVLRCATVFNDVDLTWYSGPPTSFVIVSDMVSSGQSESLTLTATSAISGTTYYCVAKNLTDDSEVEVAGTVLVQGPPSDPEDVTLEPLDLCAVDISWSRPHHLDGVPLFYNLTFINTSTGQGSFYATIEEEAYRFIPKDLGSTYSIIIVAWNGAGSSNGVTSNIMFTEEEFVANFHNMEHCTATRILNFTLSNPCESQVIDSATINICPDAEEHECEGFLVPKELIEQRSMNELGVLFYVRIPDNMNYTSTVCMRYESHQEICSMNPLLISIFDTHVKGVTVPTDSASTVCFDVMRDTGSVLYALVVQFEDKTNHNIITKLAEVDNTNRACVNGLAPGQYRISVAELDVPPLSTDEEVTIEAVSGISTLITSSSSPTSCVEMGGGLTAGLLALYIVIAVLGLIATIIIAVAILYMCVVYQKQYRRNRNAEGSTMNLPSVIPFPEKDDGRPVATDSDNGHVDAVKTKDPPRDQTLACQNHENPGGGAKEQPELICFNSVHSSSEELKLPIQVSESQRHSHVVSFHNPVKAN